MRDLGLHMKCRHRTIPTFDSSVIKAGQLLKKGSRSANLTKRCVVLLQDRIVIYGKVGDSYAIVAIAVSLHFIGLYQFSRM